MGERRQGAHTDPDSGAVLGSPVTGGAENYLRASVRTLNPSARTKAERRIVVDGGEEILNESVWWRGGAGCATARNESVQ